MVSDPLWLYHIIILLTIDREFESQRLTFEGQLEGLVEVLLGIANRSSYGVGPGVTRVFDPLALKAMKLDFIAYCSILLDMSRLDNANGNIVSDVGSSEVSVVKLFEDGLESASGFKWLPPWSTETSVAFRTFH
ncbi:hypothetical protein Tco_0516504 [Tanacetum coccineum]